LSGGRARGKVVVMNETPALGNTDNDTLGKREGPPDGSGHSSPPKKGKGASKGTGSD
jgi:hypothetical protein